MGNEITELATDEEVEEIYRKASAHGYMYWPELIRIINRLRVAERDADIALDALREITEKTARNGSPSQRIALAAIRKTEAIGRA